MIRARITDQRGFTLVETLVAMLAGVIVIGALFAILETSLKQTSRINDRVQATQLGNNMMTRIIDPLHSACIAREATPVQEGSTPTKLIFITGFSANAVLSTENVYKDTIEWSESTGKVQFSSAKANGGSWPTFTSFGTPTTTTIGEYVTPPLVEEGGEKFRALFRYYKYNTTTSSTGETGVSGLTQIAGGKELKTAEAKTVAGVAVNFKIAPADNLSTTNRYAEFTSQNTFAFASPGSEATISDAPCE